MTFGRLLGGDARPAPFEFDRAWEFPVTPDVFWRTVQATEEYPRWWGWLRSFHADGLRPGTKAEFVVQGALPYKLRFVVSVKRVVEEQLVEADVSGDLEGPAALRVEPADDGCVARLQWQLEPHEPLLRRLDRVSHPLLAWSHDQVIAMGVAQFRRRLVRGQS
jgi:uncharacterized protein YndB with AHSA1/START domain